MIIMSRKQYHKKVLLHLNSHTKGFYPQTQMLGLPCDHKEYQRKELLHLNSPAIGFPTDSQV